MVTLSRTTCLTWICLGLLGCMVLQPLSRYLVSNFGLLVRPTLTRTASVLTSAMSSSPEYSMVFVTAPSEEVAKKIAGGVVSGKLAACVNIIPGITSVYEWQGKIENDQEVLMMIKTRTSKVDSLAKFVTENHPYDVPEVISTSIEQGNQKYLEWIGQIVPK